MPPKYWLSTSRGLMIAPGREGADQAGRADHAEIGIDFHLGEHGAMRVHGVLLLQGRIGRARPFADDLGDACARHDVDVAFAARLVVAPREAAVSRDHAGVAGAVERRLRIVGRERGKLGDDVAAGVVQREARGRGMAGAARHAAVGMIRGAGAKLHLVERQRERVGADLRERGAGALTHVMRGRRDMARARRP